MTATPSLHSSLNPPKIICLFKIFFAKPKSLRVKSIRLKLKKRPNFVNKSEPSIWVIKRDRLLVKIRKDSYRVRGSGLIYQYQWVTRSTYMVHSKPESGSSFRNMLPVSELLLRTSSGLGAHVSSE